jgi:hypothetical protein
MSKIINPFDLSKQSIEDLLRTNLIIESSVDNKAYHATLFPESIRTLTDTLSYDKDHILTYIDDNLYTEYKMIILSKRNQEVFINQGKKFIKCKEFGDYNNSVKRFININKPVSYNKDNNINNFLNLPKPIAISLNVSEPVLIFNPGVNISPKLKKSKEELLFGQELKHPHINTPKITGDFKNNNKHIIKAVFEWAQTQNIKYIYSINENRPNVISNNYLLNSVYYTITGSK